MSGERNPRCVGVLLTGRIHPGGQTQWRAREVYKEGNQWQRENLWLEMSHIYQPMRKEEIRWEEKNSHAGTFYG